MKKLSFLISTSCIFFILSCCKHSHSSKTENVDKTVQQESVKSIVDTVKKINQTPASGTVGTDQGIKKDTSNTPVKVRAIIHQAPDQQKIDSLKAAKEKTK